MQLSAQQRRTRSGRHDRRCRCQRTATTDDRSSPRKRSQGHPFDHAMSTIMPRSPRSLVEWQPAGAWHRPRRHPCGCPSEGASPMHRTGHRPHALDPDCHGTQPAAVGHERVGRCCEGMLGIEVGEGWPRVWDHPAPQAGSDTPPGSAPTATARHPIFRGQRRSRWRPPERPPGNRRGLGARPGSRTCSTAVTPQYTSQARRRRPRLDAGGRRASGVVAASRRGQRIVAVPRSVLSTPPVRGT